MNTQTTRRARRDAERNRRGGRSALLGGLAILVLGGTGLGFVVSGPDTHTSAPTVPTECTTTQRVPVITNQAMANVLATKPMDPKTCIELDTTHKSDGFRVDADPQEDSSAGLRIPVTASFFSSAVDSNRFSVHTASVASSPPVVVTGQQGKEFTSWTEVIGDKSVVMGDPMRNCATHAAVRSATAEFEAGVVSKQQLRQAMTSRALGSASPTQPLNERELLDSTVTEGRSVVVSERSYLEWIADHPEQDHLRALTPNSGAWLLEYPLLVPTEGAARNTTIAQAANEIARYLASDQGQAALSDQYLRAASGSRLPDARSVALAHPLQVSEEADWNRLMTTWSRQTSAHNTLYLLDASGSMGRENRAANRSYWQTAVDSTVIRTQFVPVRDSLGLWTSAQMPNAQQPYERLVPPRPLDDTTDGATQRKRIQNGLAEADVAKNSKSGLYDATLAAFREIKNNYQAGAVNSVVVISDDSPNHGDAKKLQELVRTLKREQSQQQPVHIVTMAISEHGAPQDLQEIAEATGGTSHAAATLQDIQEQYLHALSVF